MGTTEPFHPPGKWTAENVRTGLFLAAGPDFRNSELEETISILDIASTILHASGLPIPEDMGGEVLDVFDKDSDPANQTVSYRQPMEFFEANNRKIDESVARERLEDIGYLQLSGEN